MKAALFALCILPIFVLPDRPAPPSHDLWHALLQQHVAPSGRVDYPGFQKDMDLLEEYLDRLAAHAPEDDWTRVEKLAYWINAYNAFTVKLVAEHYPVSSIMDINEGKVWEERVITLGGETLTLQEMEDVKLREEIGDPRIHFAINCAALSCPPLYNEAYRPGNVDRLLDERTRAFIRHEGYNFISPNRLELSKIFEWYGSDFGALIPFLNHYLEHPIEPDASITYRPYNWQLNGTSGN